MYLDYKNSLRWLSGYFARYSGAGGGGFGHIAVSILSVKSMKGEIRDVARCRRPRESFLFSHGDFGEGWSDTAGLFRPKEGKAGWVSLMVALPAPGHEISFVLVKVSEMAYRNGAPPITPVYRSG